MENGLKGDTSKGKHGNLIKLKGSNSHKKIDNIGTLKVKKQ